jgi:hypothetical protein
MGVADIGRKNLTAEMRRRGEKPLSQISADERRSGEAGISPRRRGEPQLGAIGRIQQECKRLQKIAKRLLKFQIGTPLAFFGPRTKNVFQCICWSSSIYDSRKRDRIGSPSTRFVFSRIVLYI